MLAKAPLPKGVSAVGDRIGLNYHLDKNSATRQYVDEYQEASRLDLNKLKFSYYSLDESRTKTANNTKKRKGSIPRNPLKLNSRIRKTLYRITDEEKKNMRYSTFMMVHELWQQYAAQVVIDKDKMTIFRIDLHGCQLKCVASKNPSLVGIEGIVVQETKHTFLVIRPSNCLATLPKRESIFEFKVAHNKYRIHGSNLLFSSHIRSKVKYKQKRCLIGI